MIRRPPRSTLFPSRRSSDLTGVSRKILSAENRARLRRLVSEASHNRSEEHTSELQSHSDLVCRLLLEKKKKKTKNLKPKSILFPFTLTPSQSYFPNASTTNC